MKDKKAKLVLCGVDTTVRVKEGKYGQRTLYTCKKIEP
jgi:hypothetical protein